MECPKCKAIIDDNSLVCSHCNKVILLECPNCHTLGESAICEKCGYNILVKCSKCSAIVPFAKESCVKCGYSTKDSLALSECESDELASIVVEFESLNSIKKSLKSKELYAKFFYKLKNILYAQIKNTDCKFVVYENKFVINFNKELSFASSSNKAVRMALKIVNSYVNPNTKVQEEFGIPLNLKLSIIRKTSEQLLDLTTYKTSVKPLIIKKNSKKYLKGIKVLLDQYVRDEIYKDFKTDSLYAQEENGKSLMFYELLLDSYVLPPQENNDIEPSKVVSQKSIESVKKQEEHDKFSFNVFDIKAKCTFIKTPTVQLLEKMQSLNLSKNGKIISLSTKFELAPLTSDLVSFYENKGFEVLTVTCTEELTYKPWGFFEVIFKEHFGITSFDRALDIKNVDSKSLEKHRSLFEFLSGKILKTMTPEDARFAYMELWGKFLSSLNNTVILVDGFELLDDTTIQTLTLYFDKFRTIIPNFLFITSTEISVHSKIKGLLRTSLYTEFTLTPSSLDYCLETLALDGIDFIQSFYFEKIKENFNGSYLYFYYAVEYLKQLGVLIEFENKLIVKNKNSLILPKNLKGLYKTRVKAYSKNMDLSLILAYSTILGPRIDCKTLQQLGIKDLDNVLQSLESSGLVFIKENFVYIEHYCLFNQVLKSSIKKEVNNFLAKNIIAQIGKGLDETTKIVTFGLLEAYKEEYLNLWKISQFAIKTGDYDAYLKNCLGFLSLVGLIGVNVSKSDIEENKREVFNNILLSLYSYSPTKIYHIENLLLIDAINEGDDEKIVKLSNLMLQGALVSSNYTDALRLLHNILSRMPEPTLLVNGAVNTKFLLLSLINIEILYNIGNFKSCVEIAEDVLSVLSFDILEKIKPASFSVNLFVSHLLETLRLAAFAKIQLLDDDVDEFLTKIEQKLGQELPEKTCIKAIQEYLAGQIYSNGDVENVSPLTKVILLILQEFSVLKYDYKRFAQNIYQAKLLALDIHQKEIEVFCDLLIAYSYAKIGITEKAVYIYDDILQQAEKSAMYNLIAFAKYFKALLCIDLNDYDEAMQIINDSLAMINRYNNQAKILYVLFEKLYINLVTVQGVSAIDTEVEELKIIDYSNKLKVLMS